MSFQPKTKTKQWGTRASIYGLLINYSVPQVKVFRHKKVNILKCNFRLQQKFPLSVFFFYPFVNFEIWSKFYCVICLFLRPATFGCSLVTGDLHSGSLHVFEFEFYAGCPSQHNSYCLKVLSHPSFPHTSILGSM